MGKVVREICRTVEAALAGWPQTAHLILIIAVMTAAYVTITELACLHDRAGEYRLPSGRAAPSQPFAALGARPGLGRHPQRIYGCILRLRAHP